MKTNLISVFLLILITGFYACESPYVFNDINNPSKIVVQCELDPNSLTGNRVFVSTSLNMNGDGEFLHPQDAVVGIEILDSEDSPEKIGETIILDYKEEWNAYAFPSYLKLYSGDRLEMRVHLNTPGFTDIITETTLPSRIENIESTSDVVIGDVVDGVYDVNINSNFNFENTSNNPYIKIKATLGYRKYKMEDGKIVFTDTEDLVNLVPSSNNDNLDVLVHKKGIYFDATVDNSAAIQFSPKASVPENCVLTSISYDYINLTEDVYLYDLCIDNNIKFKNSAYTEPIVTHSNISNGVGVFGAVNVVTEKILLVE